MNKQILYQQQGPCNHTKGMQEKYFKYRYERSSLLSSRTTAMVLTLKEETFAEETFASVKIRESFGRNFREFRELANFVFFARIIFREFML